MLLKAYIYHINYLLFCHIQAYFNSFSIEKLGKNIPVTIAYPGPVQTNFLTDAYTEKLKEVC